MFFTIFMAFMVCALGSQQPVFKSKVEVVQLDVSVLDKHRQPVRGLTQQDFTILEDGKTQPIVGFSAFDVDDDAPPASGWMRDVAPDVATNEYKESRIFVIVMDDAMIPQHPAFIRDSKKIAAQIIEKFGPNDLVAIVFTGDNRKTQDFTTDKTKLKAALENFNPGLAGYRFGIDAGGLEIDMHFFISAVRTLSEVADYLIAVPNRRKALFWISPGVPFDAETMIAGRSAVRPTASASTPPSQTAIDMRDLAERTELIFKRAQQSNVTIYPVDPTGLGGMRAFIEQKLPSGDINLPILLGLQQDAPDYENRRTSMIIRKVNTLQDFLAEAAARTGGRTVMNTNDWDRGIEEVFAENASYYLLGFEPTNAAADGTLRRLQVKVNRPDVEIRTRRTYYAPEPPKTSKKPDKNQLSPESQALTKSMSGILPLSGMPMRAAVAPFAVPGQRLSTVTIVLGITQPVPATAANGRVTETTELLTSAFTPEGDARGAQRHQAKVVIRAGANGTAAYEALARIDLPPGRYSLRLAAHNSTSNRDGSVFADVTVPDYSNAPFSATPVVLSANPGRVSAPKDLFAPLLPLVPTAEREFGRSDKVTAFLRLYQSGQKPIGAAQVTISIRDTADQVKANETQALSVDRFLAAERPDALPVLTPRPRPTQTPTTDQFANLALRTADVKYSIPVDRLTAGAYLLTIEATVGATTIRRDVRFTVK